MLSKLIANLFAALLYLVTLCFSAQQFWMNNKSTYRLFEKTRPFCALTVNIFSV